MVDQKWSVVFYTPHYKITKHIQKQQIEITYHKILGKSATIFWDNLSHYNFEGKNLSEKSIQ